MFRSLCKRSFAFKPTQPLTFVDGRCRILENPVIGSAAVNMTVGLGLGTAYIGSRIVRFFSELGWLSLSFHSLALVAGAVATLECHKTIQQVVIAVDLLDTGKTIELTSRSLFGKPHKTLLDICDITDPRETRTGKLYMSALHSWVILGKKQVYIISNTAHLFHSSVAEAIVKGEEIDVTNEIHSDHIIDV